jgi:TolA-binding protein
VRDSNWRSLADRGLYKEAFAAANVAGFEGICATATVDDLRALGDAARLAGSPASAVQALVRLRERFRASPEAAAAAFFLGRVAQDQRDDPAGAARWFRSYLAEEPSGEFAAEALGRLVEIEDTRGEADAARKVAERYLATYPQGPHAGYARAVLAGARRAP